MRASLKKKRSSVHSTSKSVSSSSFSAGKLQKTAVSLSEVRKQHLAAQAEAKAKARSRFRELIANVAVELGQNFDEDDVLTNMHSGLNTDARTDAEESTSASDQDVSDNGIEDRQSTMRMLTSRQPGRVRRSDKRQRLDRNRAETQGWALQIEALVDAYLSHTASLNQTNEVSAPHSFVVTTIGTHEYNERLEIPQCHDEFANVALLRHGLLGCSPSTPSVAFTLEKLEQYHLHRRRQSNFSIQAFTKVFCAHHNLTYSTTLRNQFSTTFDVYLNILRLVSERIDAVLSRDSTWKIKYNCPSCTWKLPDEPKLNPARMHAMDGNNALKRLMKAGTSDERVFNSPLFLSPEEVQHFENDVKKSKNSKPRKRTEAGSQREEEDEPIHAHPTLHPAADEIPNTNPNEKENTDFEMGEGEGEVGNNSTTTTVVQEGDEDEDDLATCVEHWRASTEVREETLQVFDQTGVFVCVCRHGIVEFVAEMKKMGEGSKYGLAVLDKVLDVYEEDQSMGYDIGCRMKQTVTKSSLAQKAKDKRLQFAVDSFHGHAHHRLCQLNNLPLYLKGVGIEDFSTCERVFSSSNTAARLVRYASYFHWRQFIDLHYQQWNEDRYADQSKFLFDNYRQALQIIKEFTPQIEKLKKELSVTDDAFLDWHKEELDFIMTRSKAPALDPKLIKYANAIDNLDSAEEVAQAIDKLHDLSLDSDPDDDDDYEPSDDDSDRDDKRQHKAFLRKLAQRRRLVSKLETELKIATRWTAEHPDYLKTKRYIRDKKFIAVVEKLEGLVVRRLMEMTKANLAETGYKLRTQISSAMARRSQSIRTAINNYNDLAPQMTPPRDPLSYKKVMSYTMLGEFEILKYTTEDILSRPWSINTTREVAAKYFKIVRAREELVRLNVELDRLHDWVDYDDAQWLIAVNRLKEQDPGLAHQVRRRQHQQLRINNVHRKYIKRIYSLMGYTGQKRPITIVSSCGRTEPRVEDELAQIDEDDAAVDELGRMTDFIEGLADG